MDKIAVFSWRIAWQCRKGHTHACDIIAHSYPDACEVVFKTYHRHQTAAPYILLGQKFLGIQEC